MPAIQYCNNIYIIKTLVFSMHNVAYKIAPYDCCCIFTVSTPCNMLSSSLIRSASNSRTFRVNLMAYSESVVMMTATNIVDVETDKDHLGLEISASPRAGASFLS